MGLEKIFKMMSFLWEMDTFRTGVFIHRQLCGRLYRCIKLHVEKK